MRLATSFIAFDDALAAHGVPPCSAKMREGICTWLDAYEDGGALELWACIGRGGAKSTALYKLACFFACFVDFAIPPGERHYAIVLSRLKEEAGKGIAIIDAWLAMLGIEHARAGDVIELADRPVGIRVVAASVQAASGWRCFVVACDEFSKWAAGGTDLLDASEVRSSAVAMTATHARAPIVTMGSAWAAEGEFYDAIQSGTDTSKVVLGPWPTWVAAPHITEDETRRKERDPKRWAREYACQFQGGVTSALDVDGLAACIRNPREAYALAGAEVVLDASGGRFDGFSAYLVQWIVESSERPEYVTRALAGGLTMLERDAAGQLIRDPQHDPPRPRLLVRPLFYEVGDIASTWTTDDVAGEISRLSRRYDATIVHGDQHAAWSWESDFRRYGMRFVSHPWDNPGKTEAVIRLRTMIRERSLVIQPGEHGDGLLDEAKRFVERLTPSGLTSFGARRGRDDRIMTLVLAARIDAERGLRGSPVSQSGERTEVYVRGP